MKNIKIALFSLLAIQPSWSNAALGYRTTTVDAVQMESSTRVGYENIMYVRQAVAWVGLVNCDTTYAYFNAAENPYLAGMALSARLHNKPLRVYVDDSLPKMGVFCQIINIEL